MKFSGVEILWKISMNLGSLNAGNATVRAGNDPEDRLYGVSGGAACMLGGGTTCMLEGGTTCMFGGGRSAHY
jgi:hypothetical protein